MKLDHSTNASDVSWIFLFFFFHHKKAWIKTLFMSKIQCEFRFEFIASWCVIDQVNKNLNNQTVLKRVIRLISCCLFLEFFLNSDRYSWNSACGWHFQFNNTIPMRTNHNAWKQRANKDSRIYTWNSCGLRAKRHRYPKKRHLEKESAHPHTFEPIKIQSNLHSYIFINSCSTHCSTRCFGHSNPFKCPPSNTTDLRRLYDYYLLFIQLALGLKYFFFYKFIK